MISIVPSMPYRYSSLTIHTITYTIPYVYGTTISIFMWIIIICVIMCRRAINEQIYVLQKRNNIYEANKARTPYYATFNVQSFSSFPWPVCLIWFENFEHTTSRLWKKWIITRTHVFSSRHVLVAYTQAQGRKFLSVQLFRSFWHKFMIFHTFTCIRVQLYTVHWQCTPFMHKMPFIFPQQIGNWERRASICVWKL